MKKIDIITATKEYPIYIQKNILSHIKKYLDTERNYVIISDDGIPKEYIEKVASSLPNVLTYTFPQGETSKSIQVFSSIIDFLLRNNVKRDACLIALGGGVTGDLVGYVASSYLRGIDYIQIPTTLLSQIDSSVGGKVAINSDQAKNVIGSIYHPLMVLIDPDVLKTLSERQRNNGMGEMIKYGMIADKELFDKMKNEDVFSHPDEFIYRSLMIKKKYVEADEFDQGLRQSLNFGHTYGHAIESFYHYEKYLHGEAIAIGMVMILKNDQIRKELVEVLKKYHLPTSDAATLSDLKKYINNDKKNRKDLISIVEVTEIGKCVITKQQYDL